LLPYSSPYIVSINCSRMLTLPRQRMAACSTSWPARRVSLPDQRPSSRRCRGGDTACLVGQLAHLTAVAPFQHLCSGTGRRHLLNRAEGREPRAGAGAAAGLTRRTSGEPTEGSQEEAVACLPVWLPELTLQDAVLTWRRRRLPSGWPSPPVM